MKQLTLYLLAACVVLTGCIGETYDFSPPSVTLLDPNSTINEAVLAEANIAWHSDPSYDTATDNVAALANTQREFYVQAGQLIDYMLEDGFFDGDDGVTIEVMQEDTVTALVKEGVEAFRAPEQSGQYVLIFNLDTTKGHAQYVGKLIVQ